jgi:hypothetical protein
MRENMQPLYFWAWPTFPLLPRLPDSFRSPHLTPLTLCFIGCLSIDHRFQSAVTWCNCLHDLAYFCALFQFAWPFLQFQNTMQSQFCQDFCFWPPTLGQGSDWEHLCRSVARNGELPRGRQCLPTSSFSKSSKGDLKTLSSSRRFFYFSLFIRIYSLYGGFIVTIPNKLILYIG